jgi:hypothetical protein
MATIWKEIEANRFVPTPVDSLPPAGSCGFLVLPYRDATRQKHALIVPPAAQARFNGRPVVGAICVLEHKDEVVVEGQRMFFSVESKPEITAYRHDDSRRRPRCPTCRQPIEDGEAVVRCPGCERIYHQIGQTDEAPEKPCWTYAPKCRFCEHPTALVGEPTWRPEHENDEPKPELLV